jgi:hypothetical protein
MTSRSTGRSIFGALAAAALGLAAVAESAQAQETYSEQYIPTIWVDPDGCEHWVMDDGVEGYMTPHTTRQGIPVCRRGNVCGVVNTDQMFATDTPGFRQQASSA